MEKGKRIETVNGKTLLPEAIIQHIQSFLSEEEAARTTLLSKSWYRAWITGPTLVINQRRFKNRNPERFAELATKTIQRYQDLNLKIESFTLRTQSSKRGIIDLLASKLILEAMKMGATHLNLEFRASSKFVLPREVLGSGSLLRLSVKGCEIDGIVSCSMLKSLSFDSVHLKSDDMIRVVVSRCTSIEELSLSSSGNSNSRKLMLSKKILYKLQKLRRLYLKMVVVFASFFDDLESRFPCLEDLSLVRCHGYSTKCISSTSLQRISIEQPEVFTAYFDVPNLAYFSYSGVGIPSVSIKAREWESCISLKSHCSRTSSWYLKLQKMLAQLSPSRITLSLNILLCSDWCKIDDVEDIQDVAEPVFVENLTIEARFDLGCDLVVGLFWICRPKILTHYWLPFKSCKYWNANNQSLKNLLEKLMKEVSSPNCGVPDQNTFGRFGLKKVNVEVYEEINLTEWRPLLLKERLDALMAPPNKRKIRFQLKWR